MKHTVGFIGVGEIARAIVDGLCSGPGVPPEVFLSPRSNENSTALAEQYRSATRCSGNQEVVDCSSIVVVAVRPDTLDAVLAELHVPDDWIVVSVVAGVSLDALHLAIVRAIPLPAAKRRRSITAICPHHESVAGLFATVGDTIDIDDEATFTAIQATTASLSSQLLFLAGIAAWLAEQGLAHHDAERYVCKLFDGVAGTLAAEDSTLADLARAHETPGGINEQFRMAWHEESRVGTLRRALDGIHEALAARGKM